MQISACRSQLSPRRWLDATYLKQREGGQIVSVAPIFAAAAGLDGRREIIGLKGGPSEAETYWSGFLKVLIARVARAGRGLPQSQGVGLAPWQEGRLPQGGTVVVRSHAAILHPKEKIVAEVRWKAEA